MLDLTEELLETIEPFDITISSWIDLKHRLGGASWDRICRRALSTYLEDRVSEFQLTYGKDQCDAALRNLVGVHDALIRAGWLTGDPLADKILIYAAHLAALTSYGPAVWDRTAKVMLQAQTTVKAKDLKR